MVDEFDEIMRTRAIAKEPYAVNIQYGKISVNEIESWLKEHCDGEYKTMKMMTTFRIVFINKEALTLFSMRWL